MWIKGFLHPYLCGIFQACPLKLAHLHQLKKQQSKTTQLVLQNYLLVKILKILLNFVILHSLISAKHIGTREGWPRWLLDKLVALGISNSLLAEFMPGCCQWACFQKAVCSMNAFLKVNCLQSLDLSSSCSNLKGWFSTNNWGWQTSWFG